MNRKKTYILYNYNEFTKDFNYIKEYYNINELLKDNKIEIKNKKSIYHFVYNSIDNITHLLKDKYIIIKELL